MAESGIMNFEVDGARVIEHGDICEMCEHTVSVGYCSECECYICQSCFDNHIKVKKYNHHVLQIAPDSKEDDRTVHFKTCTEHTQQEVRLYCTDHKCFGCAECMLFNHRSCEYKYITEASKEFEDSGELALFLEDIQDLENVHENCIESIASQSELSNKIDKTTANDVHKFVKDVVSYVTDEEKRVIKNADSKKSANDDKLEKLSDDLQDIGSDITSISADVRSEDRIYKMFILAMETKQKLVQIRDKLESIDCQNVIDRYTFYPDRLIQHQLSEKRPLGNLSDNTQSEEDDFDYYERNYKAECLDTQRYKQQLSIQDKNTNRLEQQLSTQQQVNKRLQQQLSTQEQHSKQQLSSHTQVIQRLHQQLYAQEQECKQQCSTQKQENQRINQQLSTQKQYIKRLQQQLSTQEQELNQLHSQCILACGHVCDVSQMNTSRTIECPTCGIIFGDQPDGTLRTEKQGAYSKLIFKFGKGMQSTLNLNPGKPYEGNEVTGYVEMYRGGPIILGMLKLALNRKLLFTINTNGHIVTNKIDIFTEPPPRKYGPEWHRRMVDYCTSSRVNEQLRAKGITEADVA